VEHERQSFHGLQLLEDDEQRQTDRVGEHGVRLGPSVATTDRASDDRIIAATGLRIGELLALRWKSLDLEIGTLSVRESVLGKFQSPKTQKSRRTIPLGPRAIASLRNIVFERSGLQQTTSYSGIAAASRCGNRSYFRRSCSQPPKPPGWVE
jgi:integrase